MSKQISAQELAEIVTKLLTGDPVELSGSETFSEFMTDIAEVVCKHCGGEVRHEAAPLEDVWYIGIHGDGRISEMDGGVWRDYDKEGELFPSNSDAEGPAQVLPNTGILPAVSTSSAAWSNEAGPMTDGQYVALKGVRCPSCGSSDVSGNQLEVNAGEAFQPMNCSECGATWSDSYALTGYSDLEGGVDLEAVESAVEDVRTRSRKYGFSVDGDAQAREVISESCGIIGVDLSEPEVKIAVAKLMC